MLLPLIISIIVAYIAFEASLMIMDGLTARQLGRSSAPFCRAISEPIATVMFIGDSTAVGTGAQHPSRSIASQLAQDFPDITIMNHGINGASSKDLIVLLSQHPEWRADLLIIHIGGIDIMGLRSIRSLRSNTVSILRLAKRIAPRIVLVTPPDLGSIPYFRFPLSLLFSLRSRQARDFVLHRAKKGDFVHVDLYTDAPDDPFRTDRSRYFATDHIHPSDDGYALWYEAIKQALTDRGWINKLRKRDS